MVVDGSQATGAESPALWHPDRDVGLARALVKAGYGSRRQTEEMVRLGRVCVGTEIVTDPSHTVRAGEDVFLDARPLECVAKRYFALHKPTRVVCCANDGVGTGQRLLGSYFPRGVTGLVSVGRMDTRSTGLILVSNDTVWNTQATAGGLVQEYQIRIEGVLTAVEARVMEAGVHLPKLGLFRPEEVRIVDVVGGGTTVNFTVRSGKIRQVRRMLTTLHHKVTRVHRVRIGEIRLRGLAPGAARDLTAPEIASIDGAKPATPR